MINAYTNIHAAGIIRRGYLVTNDLRRNSSPCLEDLSPT